MERINIATILLITGLFLSAMSTNEKPQFVGNLLWLGSVITLIVLFITN